MPFIPEIFTIGAKRHGKRFSILENLPFDAIIAPYMGRKFHKTILQKQMGNRFLGLPNARIFYK